MPIVDLSRQFINQQWLVEQVILVKLSADQQMIKYAQYLSGKSDYANFCTSSCFDPQEELLRKLLC
jgi:tRNA U38,U39,U40 pseudouridine synthase TruA